MILSVIIVAYKNWKTLRKTLLSLEKYNDLSDNMEVIIVDNSPENERVEKYIEKDWSFTYIYIPNENKGFGHGNNVGVRFATGQYLAFINPDIIFIEPVFQKVIQHFEENKNTVMLGVKLLSPHGKENTSFKYDYKYSFISRQIIKILNRINLFDESCMYIEGADIFVRKTIFMDAGMFDENIFMYYEEADLIRRIRALSKDYHTDFLSNLSLIHMENGATPNSINATINEIKSCIYFGKKYNLKYQKKIQADYRYMLMKNFILSIAGKGNKYQKQLNVYQTEIRKWK